MLTSRKPSTILPDGRTALWITPSALFMSLYEVKKRTVVWTCLAIVTLVAGFGQSLHQLVGIRHDCSCATVAAATDSGHSCLDSTCAFQSSHSDAPDRDEGTAPISPDCCAVCRIIAHMGNGYFSLPSIDSELTVAGRELFVDTFCDSAVPNFNHAPRGPPSVL